MRVGWLLLAVALLSWPAPRVRGLSVATAADAPGRLERVGLHGVAACGAALCLIVLLPLPLGLPVAATVAWVVHRRTPRSFSRPAELARLRLARVLPEAVDLLAALLRVGLTDTEALAVAGAALPEPLGPALYQVARMRRMGSDPQAAWTLARDLPELRQIAAVLSRQADSGAPVAALLERIAADARREYFSTAQAAARATAVRSVVPLGVCFLPAFFLLCVVPIVAGLVSGLMW